MYAGDGPTRSPLLDAWLIATAEGQRLRIADDPDGLRLWLTTEGRERAEKERALARLAELEAKLRGG